MTEAEIQTAMTTVLGRIAPEADLDALHPDAPLRDELGLDSIDFLHFLIGLHDELGVEIPEADYGQLTTTSAIVDYVQAAAAAPDPSSDSG